MFSFLQKYFLPEKPYRRLYPIKKIQTDLRIRSFHRQVPMYKKKITKNLVFIQFTHSQILTNYRLLDLSAYNEQMTNDNDLQPPYASSNEFHIISCYQIAVHQYGQNRQKNQIGLHKKVLFKETIFKSTSPNIGIDSQHNLQILGVPVQFKEPRIK